MPDPLSMIPAKWAQPDPSTVSKLPKGGTHLDYMGHAEVTLALLDVDPEWQWEPTTLDPETGGPIIHKQGNRLVMWGYLTLCGHRRLCVGTCEERKGDPEKELIGDLLRNGAMRFGIGTKLWSKATDADPAGSGGAGGYDRRPARPPSTPGQATDAQIARMAVGFRAAGISDRADRLAYIAATVGRDVESSKDLTKKEAGMVIDALTALEPADQGQSA